MATSSVNNNTMFTANSLYGVSSTGYKGIASGLDIDTIIDGMTAATRGKIAKQLQRKQIFQWRMDAYRSVSNKLIDFAKKYTSFTSSTNLMSNSFFSQNTITAKGSNSSSVSISGSSATAADLSILGIKKLATTASKSWAGVSDKVLATGEFDLAGETNQSLVAGSSITLKYGSSTVSLSLDSNKEYGTMEDVANALNAALKEEGMDTKIEFKAEGNKLSLLNKGDGNNTLEIKSGTESFMNLVGFKVGDKLEKTGDTLTGKEVAGLTQPVPTLDLLKGKKITFTYNGVTKSIQLPEDGTKINTGAGLAQTIQEKLDSAFGAGRINVAFEGTDAKGKLKITTTDDSSVVSMSYADDGVMGKNGVFGVANGESNRLNLDASIKESGFLQNCTPVDGEYKININETEIAFKETDTVKDFIDKINNSDAKVKVSYATTADVLTFVSTESGSSGQVNITDVAGDFAANVLGASNKSEKEGQDAVVTVSFNGTDTMDIVRNSNTFTMDGLNITLNSTFGYIKEKDGSGNETGNLVLDTTQEAITFSSKVDSDKILEAVKSMITDYNDMVDYINKELTTKPNNSSKSNYPPLTAEQKKEMSESEIQAWEEKAKAGMLFNDLDIRNLSNSLRFVLSSANSADLAKMGITTSTSYAENGKITLDEAKFKAALESDPESVKNVFLAEKTDSSLGGMMTQMKAITDKFASTTGSTKGILIEKAGSPSAPTSLLKNYLQTQMDDIDKIVDGLKTKLKSQVTRYNNQFTQLERLISQMNTQSEWLAQQFSY